MIQSLCAQSTVRWDSIISNGASYNPELLSIDDGYISMTSGFNSRQLRIWKWNFNGAVVDTQSYLFDYGFRNCGKCLMSYAPRRYLYGHTAYDSSGSSEIRLFKFNSNWDTLQVAGYRFNDTVNNRILDTRVFKILQHKDKIYVTGYAVRPQSQYDLLIAIFDTNLDLLSESKVIRNFTIGGYWGLDIDVLADSDVLISGISTKYPSPTLEDDYAIIVRTDSIGRVKWVKQLDYPSSYNGAEIYLSATSDSTYIFVGTVEILQDMYQLRIGFIDTSGTIQKDTLLGKRHHRLYVANIDDVVDGNLVVTQIVFENLGFKGKVAKLDYSGNLLWDKVFYVGDLNDASELYSGVGTLDSGVIVSGSYLDLNNNPGPQVSYYWITKLDKNGCLTDQCANIKVADELQCNLAVSVYPNPASSVVKVLADGRVPQILRLYNSVGQLVTENSDQSELELPAGLTGVYHLAVLIEGVWSETPVIIE